MTVNKSIDSDPFDYLRSIHFFDPNDHRIELACPNPEEDALLKKLDTVKWEMPEE